MRRRCHSKQHPDGFDVPNMSGKRPTQHSGGNWASQPMRGTSTGAWLSAPSRRGHARPATEGALGPQRRVRSLRGTPETTAQSAPPTPPFYQPERGAVLRPTAPSQAPRGSDSCSSGGRGPTRRRSPTAEKRNWNGPHKPRGQSQPMGKPGRRTGSFEPCNDI